MYLIACARYSLKKNIYIHKYSINFYWIRGAQLRAGSHFQWCPGWCTIDDPVAYMKRVCLKGFYLFAFRFRWCSKQEDHCLPITSLSHNFDWGILQKDNGLFRDILMLGIITCKHSIWKKNHVIHRFYNSIRHMDLSLLVWCSRLPYHLKCQLLVWISDSGSKFPQDYIRHFTPMTSWNCFTVVLA